MFLISTYLSYQNRDAEDVVMLQLRLQQMEEKMQRYGHYLKCLMLKDYRELKLPKVPDKIHTLVLL